MPSPARPPLVAKLCPPRLFGVQRRPRLFRALDTLRKRHPVLWVSAPPGAGKSALAASYLQHRRLPARWLELDAGDSEPATFFHYLGLGVARARAPLPALTPDRLADLAGFARRYFRQLAARLRTPGALVLDDFQAIAADSPVQLAVAELLGEVPPGLTVIVLSRQEPPPALARLVANRTVGTLDAGELRLTRAEARGLAGPTRLSPALFAQVEALADGWAAGVVLLAEQARRHGALQQPAADGHQALFDYFARQVFERATPEERRFWMATSVLPHLTAASAAELTGDPRAGERLGALYRGHLFLDRRAAPDGPRFHAHALFRAFLAAQAKQHLAPAELDALALKAGRLLEAEGQLEQAVERFARAQAWPEVARLACAAAPGLLQQGRNLLLSSWTRQVPAAARAQAPWLVYWEGLARLPFDQAGARALFEEAFAALRERGDAVGALLACAGVLESFLLEFNDFTPADPWIASFDALVAQLAPALTPELECSLLGAVQTLQIRRPQAPSLDAWLARARRLARSAPAAYQRVTAAYFCVARCVWLGELREAEQVIAEARPSVEASAGAPSLQLLWKIHHSIVQWQAADHAGASRTLDEVHQIARASGVGFLEFIALGSRVYAALSAGQLAEAEALLARMEPLLAPGRRMDVNYLANLKAGAALLAGDAEQAVRWARASLEATEAAGAPLNAAVARSVLAQALLAAGDAAAARRELDVPLAVGRGQGSGYLRWLALVALAQCELAAGRPAEAHAALREAFALGRRQGYLNCHPFWSARGMARLCAEALRHGIEPDYARRLIGARGLVPDSPDVAGWPWPVALRALGRLTVVLGGSELVFVGKAQQKPLELLKALIGLGGRGVSLASLADAVWPDAEGDAARALLEVNLHRLRKLLGPEQVIAVSAGRLSLDERRCHLDVWALERLAAELRAGPLPAGVPALEALVARLNALYADDFLADDDGEPWTARPRDRLAERYAEAARALCEALRRAGAVSAEADACRAAIERQPRREEFYGRLMRCCLELGRPSEALDVYRRCRANLAALAGAAPSLELERLRARVVGTA